ncbi:autotransporter outer membrane beta-barrel domain-containing protein [Leptotrichia alba]|uniref:Autotransporter outer membrane beta-barrel domain-containing protein n=1 Tax=Leptotrichia alba TaxID=3239304 RepID=A0AB39V774_9FUSO
MKTKNSRKSRKLMLLASLCAILSCSSGGGGGSGSGDGSASNTPTPGNSSVVITDTRFTATPNLAKLKEGIYEELDYNQADSYTAIIGGNNTTIYDNIHARKYGLDVSGGITISSPTIMNVKKDGSAFWHDTGGLIGRNDIKGIFNDISNPNRLVLNMQEGSNLLTIKDAEIKLTDSDFSNIISEVPGLNSRISGTGYNEVKFNDSKLIIDEDINLDDENNKYYKTLSKITPTKITLETNKTITGTKDEQVAIKASNRIIDWGTIKLTGKNSVALFSKKTIWNSGPIEVGENSIAQYTVYDKPSSDNENENRDIITLGKSSIGIRIDREYNNIGGEGINNNTGKILSTAEKSIGIMAYTVDKPHSTGDTDHFKIENHGEINLSGDISTGIYVTGKSSTKMYNNGEIIMGDSSDRNNPSIGMFSINPNNYGENGFFGFMKVGKNSIGMVGVNGGKLKNEGRIVIAGDGGIGMYLADGTEGFNASTIETDGEGLKDVIGVVVGKDSKFTNEAFGKILINSVNGKGVVFEKGAVVVNNGEIKVNGTNISPEEVELRPVTVKALSDKINPVKSDLGIYMNSLGKTNPIEGLANLGLNSADLLIGAEATEKTNATEVTVGQDVLKPFNDSMQTSRIADWTVKSGSLVWKAEPEIKDNKIEKVTLKKQSYTKFADEKTKDVAKGLDEKYVVASEKDKQIFNYMNTLRDAESLGKAYKEIAGSQYINVQQRINQTDNLLDSQISSLQKDNAGKAGHHVETFFNKDKHDFKTEEVPNTTSTAFGASYLFNNTDSNWGAYGGVAINNYKFKDKGHSKESVSMLKAGGYKKFDLSIGDLDWTLGGDMFVSQNSMKRRIMTDKVYENKADYNAYGFSVKNEISKTYELGENSTIKPYGALKLGYGSFGKIKEKDATMGLDVKGNSYYSVKPSAGIELGYSKQVTDKTKLKASLDLAYEHELGKVDHKENEIKFINARTGYKRKSAKGESRGNLSTGVKVGLETGRFNFSVKGGYDTKDKNAHVGVGIGASF